MRYDIHHVHRRKRVHQKLEKYPSENKWIRRLDEIMIAVGIAAPLMTLPQIVEIFSSKNASGVSLLTWSLYTLFNIPWIIYGIVHKEKLITLTYITWFAVNLTVMVGAVMYG